MPKSDNNNHSSSGEGDSLGPVLEANRPNTYHNYEDDYADWNSRRDRSKRGSNSYLGPPAP